MKISGFPNGSTGRKGTSVSIFFTMLLAPTAMNQQKFNFTLENGKASAKAGKGFKDGPRHCKISF